MCGEKSFSRLPAFFLSGSPPRVRGKAVCDLRSRRRSRDHPRVCGEKIRYFPPLIKGWGSPPRVRGKEGEGKCRKNLSRITPACAGKSRTRSGAPVAFWDHPRVCGEKCGRTKINWRAVGSPPRVRGKATCRMRWCKISRITPACAGKRVLSKRLSRVYQDHPRVCGEKLAAFCWSFSTTGSPPRVRGKALMLTVSGLPDRITPACAGKSQYALLPQNFNRDHPRVCGEKTKKSP